MTVTLLSLAARSGDEVAVTFEIQSGEHSQRETFLISSALVADLRLRRGESTKECYDAVFHGANVYSAVKKGLRILGYGSCSWRMLCRKLAEKGIDKEIASEAAAELRRQGYLNSDYDAFREAERSASKLWGRRRIAAALFTKGYSDTSVRRALARLEEEGIDYAENCAHRIRMRWSDLPSEPTEKRKLMASLERYGFTGSEIREAFRMISEEIDS